MKYKEVKEMLVEHYDSVNTVNTDELLNKLRPAIITKCEKIKSQKKNSAEGIIFALSCLLIIFIGSFVLFPNYFDYTNELLQFIGMGITISLITLIIVFITKALFANDLKNQKVELRGKLL